MCSFILALGGTYVIDKNLAFQIVLIASIPIVGGFIIDWIVDIINAKENRIKEFKITIKEYIRFDLKVPAIYEWTFAYDYYYYRILYYTFKEFEEQEEQKDLIVKILSEIKTQPIHPFMKVDILKLRNKKEEIKKFIFSDIPILPISKKNGSLLGMIKFTSDLSAVPWLYDINGVFLGGLNEDGTIFNKSGTYKGKL